MSPPSAEELTETTQKEAWIKAEGWRFWGYVLAIIAAIAALMHLTAGFFR